MSNSSRIGFLGHGVFGSALGSLAEANGYAPQYVDKDDVFGTPPTILFLTVPVQVMRAALELHRAQFDQVELIVNCCKGIEVATGSLPQAIVREVLGERPYATVSGPSFASEIKAKVPTTVSIAATQSSVVPEVSKLLARPYFCLEELGTCLELELASAMKNIYAIASGYVAGSGGGMNTHAHVQVVALREYTKLIQALEGQAQVVRPGVVGDLILTCGSNESRNYQYGYALAQGTKLDGITAEGVGSVTGVRHIMDRTKTQLPLVEAVKSLIDQDESAHNQLYSAIGFSEL